MTDVLVRKGKSQVKADTDGKHHVASETESGVTKLDARVYQRITVTARSYKETKMSSTQNLRHTFLMSNLWDLVTTVLRN